MKNWLLHYVILSLMLFSCSSAEKSDDPTPDPDPDPSETVTVKVMTYNIWGVRGLTQENMEAMAAVIKEVDADIVALQEVDRDTRRNPFDITKIMAELAGYEHYWFAKAMNTHGGEYGEAIFSKLPFKETKLYTLGTPPNHQGEDRALARVTIEKDDKEFYFIATHLDHRNNEISRLAQCREIVNILRPYEKPVIFGGDLNIQSLEEESMAVLLEHLTLGCPNNNCLPTYPTPVKPEQVPRPLDYLMHAPINAFTVQSYQVYHRAGSASDHYPVVATYRLNF